jgi:putative alpha-1,2-mannosidase
MVFRVRKSDGSWGPINNTNWTWNPNPQGLFEGTTRDWMFSVPHDPYGLIGLPGQQRFAERVTDYCLNETWFNDYQYIYPYMLYYAGAANEGQRIIHKYWVPMFHEGVMFEGVKPNPPRAGWQTHYTSNSGWLLLSMLGLYPVPSPAGQFVISSPSLTKAVFNRAGKQLIVEAKNNSDENIYVRSVKVDGKLYPSYMIPAQRLAAGAKLELEMGNDATAGLGPLYIASSDGLILDANVISSSHLKFRVEAPVGQATTKVFSTKEPVKLLVNGEQTKSCDYSAVGKTVSISSAGTAAIEVLSE